MTPSLYWLLFFYILFLVHVSVELIFCKNYFKLYMIYIYIYMCARACVCVCARASLCHIYFNFLFFHVSFLVCRLSLSLLLSLLLYYTKCINEWLSNKEKLICNACHRQICRAEPFRRSPIFFSFFFPTDVTDVQWCV